MTHKKTSTMYNTSKCPFFQNITRKKLNYLAALIGGTLFFLGWWFMIDVNAAYPDVIYKRQVYYVPGVFGTIALIVVNLIPANVVYDVYHTNRKWCSAPLARVYLFLGFIIAFGAMIGASYILVNDYILGTEKYHWPGYGVFFQNLLILAANIIVKFGTKGDVY